jgi:uncharacterized protein
MEINQGINRYTDFPFPARRYLPGEDIHPSKRPEGSHLPEGLFTAHAFSAQTWQDSDRFLYAIDLFNYEYWWEAHEVLEGLWHEVGSNTSTGLFIQGLIQIAAALIKKTQAAHRGAQRLSEKGRSKVLVQPGIFLGIDVSLFTQDTDLFITNGKSAPPVIKLKIH